MLPLVSLLLKAKWRIIKRRICSFFTFLRSPLLDLKFYLTYTVDWLSLHFPIIHLFSYYLLSIMCQILRYMHLKKSAVNSLIENQCPKSGRRVFSIEENFSWLQKWQKTNKTNCSHLEMEEGREALWVNGASCTGTFTEHRILHEKWRSSQGCCSWHGGSSEVQGRNKDKETHNHTERSMACTQAITDTRITPEWYESHHCCLGQVTSTLQSSVSLSEY